MPYMLCHNRVQDFASWKRVFASHKDAHLAAGLRLVTMWRSVEGPDNVFLMFEAASLDKAKEFIRNPEAAKAGKASGVLDGEYYLLEDAGGY